MSEEMEDYRGERLGPDGPEGRARRAWDSYRRAVTPAVEPFARTLAANQVGDLLGFWLLWHVQGGYGGLLRLGFSRASIYRKVRLFRHTWGVHPDDFELPGVRIDVGEYLAGSAAFLARHKQVKAERSTRGGGKAAKGRAVDGASGE